MSAEKRILRITVAIWRMLAVATAAALAANIAEAAEGKADVAWWHLLTLMVSYEMGTCGDLLRRLSAAARLTRMRWRGFSIRTRTRTRGC